MKAKTTIPFVILFVFVLGLWGAVSTTDADAAAGQFVIDNSHSSVIFKVKHLGVSWTYGRFNKVSGSFTVDSVTPKNSSVEVTVETQTIDTNDGKRDQHLKGPDFFNAKQFPVMTFKSTSVEKTGTDAFRITGNLGLHGVTKSIRVDLAHTGSAKDPWGGFRSGYEGTFTIKRSDYGMTFMPDGVGDDVTVWLAFEGIKK